jgi:hypothetical protein
MTGWELCSRGGLGRLKLIVPDQGDLMNGHGDLGATAVPGWLALKTLWFASPAYRGPFVVRGERLDAPGPLAEGGGHTPAVGPLVVPPGPRPTRPAGT